MTRQAAQMGLDLQPPRPPTRPQGRKALAMLQAARSRGVSGVEFVAAYLFAYSQECGRLRRLGWDIASRKDGGSEVHRYWLAEFAPRLADGAEAQDQREGTCGLKDRALVITHKDCLDGHTAAWIYSRYVDREAEFVAARYGDAPPEVRGRHVVIADFSYPREVMKGLIATARSLVVLDHHKTAEAALAGIDDELAYMGIGPAKAIVFDMERSGAGLAWDYFAVRPGTCEVCGAAGRDREVARDTSIPKHDATKLHQPGCVFARRPALVNYVEARDLWRLDSLPYTREYMANVYAAPMTFEAWDVLNDRPPSIMFERGRAILEYMDQYGTKALAEARFRSLRLAPPLAFDVDSSLWTVNMPYMNCSDYLSRLMDEKGSSVVMGYFCRNDGRWQFSLRSRNGFDCSAIAKAFGGGGHKEASGFDVEHLAQVFA